MITFNVIEYFGLKDEETGINPSALASGFLMKTRDAGLIFLQRKNAETSGGFDSCQGSEGFLTLVKLYQFANIHVANAISVGQAKGLIAYVLLDSLDAATSHRFVSGINKRHLPWLGVILMNLHIVLSQVEGDVRVIQEIIGEILLDDFSAVTAANNEFVYVVRGVGFHQVPQNRLVTDIDHRLGSNRALFANARAESAG